MENKIRLFITDDHPLVAEGIKTMLQQSQNIQIVGTAKTAKDTLHQLSHTVTDILLLDINLPDSDGIELCSTLRKLYKSLKMIAITSLNEIGIVQRFMQTGGNGFLLKDMDAEELLQAITVVNQGGTYLTKTINLTSLWQMDSPPVPMLTRREKEILLLLEKGLNGPHIAEALFLSPLTIETHKKNMFQKFAVTSTIQLINEAKRLKLI